MIIAIIQARIGSTRLPAKVIKTILGKPMFFYIVERIKRVSLIDDVVIATSEEKSNDIIRKLCQEHGINCFSGSEIDVLDRFYKAAKQYKADIVLRITADCPLIDPNIIKKILQIFLESWEYDFLGLATGAGAATEKFDKKRFPDGLDTEIFTFKVLENAWNHAISPLDREHVTPYIWKRPEKFRIFTYTSDIDYSELRWTVDNQEDFEVIEAIYKNLYPQKPDFGLEDILKFFEINPILLDKNSHFIGTEGYEKFWQ